MTERKYALVFEASRDGYSIEQVYKGAVTVGDLRRILADYCDDDYVILSHDSGYTYGSLSTCPDYEAIIEEEDEEE